MGWTIKYAASARKSVKKLPPDVRSRLRKFLERRLVALENPRQIGRALKGEHLWRYRIGDFRVICELRDSELVVLVLLIGNRKSIYRQLD